MKLDKPFWINKYSVPRLTFLTFFLLLLSVKSTWAQFEVSAELRPRLEYRNGYKTLSPAEKDPAFFISQRSRLKLRYTSEKLSLFFALQDIRTWGSTSQLNLSDAYFSVHEVWGEVHFTGQAHLKVGRQELVYDDQRIFGNVNWAQQGRSHDLALFRYEKESFKLHTGFAYNQDQEKLNSTFYATPNNYKTMQFLWLHAEPGKLKGSILFLNNGNQAADSTAYFSQTLGTHLNFDIWDLKASLSGYYQMGKDHLKRNLSAGYLASELSWPLESGLVPAVGMEYLSGTGQDEGSENHSFLPLFGTNHKFNGHMDYFYVGNHANDVGLLNPYARVVYKRNDWTLNGTFHYFSSAARILDPEDPAGDLPNYLGTEVDLSVSRDITAQVILSGGYSQMFASASMQALKGGDHTTANNWAWVMLSFTPDIFIQKKE